MSRGAEPSYNGVSIGGSRALGPASTGGLYCSSEAGLAAAALCCPLAGRPLSLSCRGADPVVNREVV